MRLGSFSILHVIRTSNRFLRWFNYKCSIWNKPIFKLQPAHSSNDHNTSWLDCHSRHVTMCEKHASCLILVNYRPPLVAILNSSQDNHNLSMYNCSSSTVFPLLAPKGQLSNNVTEYTYFPVRLYSSGLKVTVLLTGNDLHWFYIR
jgi:hypothetical protein